MDRASLAAMCARAAHGSVGKKGSSSEKINKLEDEAFAKCASVAMGTVQKHRLLWNNVVANVPEAVALGMRPSAELSPTDLDDALVAEIDKIKIDGQNVFTFWHPNEVSARNKAKKDAEAAEAKKKEDEAAELQAEIAIAKTLAETALSMVVEDETEAAEVYAKIQSLHNHTNVIMLSAPEKNRKAIVAKIDKRDQDAAKAIKEIGKIITRVTDMQHETAWPESEDLYPKHAAKIEKIAGTSRRHVERLITLCKQADADTAHVALKFGGDLFDKDGKLIRHPILDLQVKVVDDLIEFRRALTFREWGDNSTETVTRLRKRQEELVGHVAAIGSLLNAAGGDGWDEALAALGDLDDAKEESEL